MSQIIKPDGIAFNGRRFNHPDMSDHIGVECTVESIDSNTVHLWLKDGTEIIATAQSAVSLNDIQPALNNRVMIIDGIAIGKQGFIWGIDECEYLIIADNDDDFPHGYQRDQFVVLSTKRNCFENYEMQSDILMQQMKNILEDHGELRAEDLFKKALEMRGETGDARQLCIDSEIDPDCILHFKGINHAS